MKLPLIKNKKPLFAQQRGAGVSQVASPGIEPGSGASETLILSIVLRGQKISRRQGAKAPSRSVATLLLMRLCVKQFLIAAKIIEQTYCCFNSLNNRSVSSFLHSSVPALRVAAVPAATP